jgi:DNA repair exonuclease SbcCD ATPase subunit
MEPDRVTIRTVSIENFRGFRQGRTIDLAASATIVNGSNGKGKTSFFDALQWLLLGSLSRLARLANRRSGEYIVNRFADAGAVATVSAELELGGRAVTIMRVGDHKSTVLTWHDGDCTLSGVGAEKVLCEMLLGDAEMSLKDIVLNSGVLQQDVVRAVLEDEPKNRYRHMAALLGLDEIAGFEADAKRRAEERDRLAKEARDEHAAAEQQLRTVDAELARVEARLSSQSDIADARTRWESELARTATLFDIGHLPTQASEAISLGQLGRQVRTEAHALIAEDTRLHAEEAHLPSSDDEQLLDVEGREEATRQQMAEAERALEEARARQRTAERRAGDLIELATRALPLLGEQCPVCEQTIQVGEVEAHLREVIDAGGEDLSSLGVATAAAQQRLSQFEQAMRELKARGDQLRSTAAKSEEARAARSRWRDSCQRLASTKLTLRSDARQQVASGDVATITELRSFADQLTTAADELAALLGSSGLTEEIERLRDQQDTLRKAVAKLGERAAHASRLAGEAKTLAAASTQAISGVTRERFARLQPLVDDIFARLAPHPAFTALGFEMGVSYRSGVADPFVKDPESGVTGDPLLVFSSSQANVAALTYFLALSWAADAQALPFLLLDDPLQSMDDVNALGFSDLCRHLRQRRQLVVSTHEQRLAALLERKLAPRSSRVRTRLIQFTGWDRDGPTIEQRDIEAESIGYLLSAA